MGRVGTWGPRAGDWPRPSPDPAPCVFPQSGHQQGPLLRDAGGAEEEGVLDQTALSAGAGPAGEGRRGRVLGGSALLFAKREVGGMWAPEPVPPWRVCSAGVLAEREPCTLHTPCVLSHRERSHGRQSPCVFLLLFFFLTQRR